MDTDVHPRPVGQIESWDLEADVVIAGYGIAGVAAAVEAATAGADVLVLEPVSYTHLTLPTKRIV